MIVWMASKKVSVVWDDQWAEHRFTALSSTSSESTTCYFPTPLFLKARLEIAAKLNLGGVALWELGQTWAMMTTLL